MTLGDMHVVGRPPAKLVKALAVIANGLHPAFDRETWGIAPGFSKQSCVLCSLAVRDFLWKIGFKDAQAAPVYFAVRAFRDDELVHSLGVGDHNAIGMTAPGPDTDARWNGHMAVKVAGFLIDPTLYQVHRKQWDGIPGMMALELETSDQLDRPYGLRPAAGAILTMVDGTRVEMMWLDQPLNRRWRESSGGDTERSRRRGVIAGLVKAFGKWQDVAA